MKLGFPKRKKPEADELEAPKPPKEKPPKTKRVRKPKKAKSKGKSRVKAFKSRKTCFVLLIGDEGAILIYIKNGVVQSRQFVPDSSQPSLNDLKGTLNEDPRAPILLAVDTMDQSYIQQTLPPVSALSVNKLIKRRLERDFGENTIKGAITTGRDKTGRKDWHFIMVALEKSPQLMAWLDFIRELPNRFRGIHLISVEAEILVKALEKSLGFVSKEGTGSKWKFFVSHNKVGGFRQVILQNGRIIFTRLAQPVSGGSNAEVVAGSIEQEMLSTIEYMKRLSFNPQEGLDIYIVTSEGVKNVIDQSKFPANNLHILTPHEVAELVGIEGASQPTDQFGDVLLAAVVGCSSKHALTLSIPYIEQIDRFSGARTGLRAVGGVASLGMLAYAGMTGYDVYSLSEEISTLNQSKLAQQQMLINLKEEISQSNVDVNKADDLIDLYKQLLQESLSPAAFIDRFSPLLETSIALMDIQWGLSNAAPGVPGAADAEQQPPPGMSGMPPGFARRGARGMPGGFGESPPEGATPGVPAATVAQGTGPTVQARMTLEFPATAATPLDFQPFAKEVLEKAKALYPGYDVKYTSIPTEFQEKDRLELDFNKTAENRPVAQLPRVEMTIIGPAIPAAPAAPQQQAEVVP